MTQQPFVPPTPMPGAPPGVPGQPQATQQGVAASMAPDDMVEGGGPPVQQNLTVKEATIDYYDYNGKAPQTVALKLVFVDDNGQTLSPQHYSIGDPTRFMPSVDKKKVMLLTGATGISKNSNHGILMTALANCQFPVDRLKDGDISVMEGLYAYWDGQVEPPRPGLSRTQQQQNRQNMILVPTQIHRFPWQAQAVGAPVAAPTAAAPAAPTMPGAPIAPAVPVAAVAAVAAVPVAPVAPVAPPVPAAPVPVAPVAPIAPVPPVNGVDLGGTAMGLLPALGPQFTLQQVMASVYSTYADQNQYPFRDQLATHVFSPEFTAALQSVGYQVQGHNVSR